MQDYHNSFVRYEPHGGECCTCIQPVRVRKEILNKKLTIVRMTECTFPRTESSSMTSVELDGWGSCSVKGAKNIPPTREQLIATGHLKPLVDPQLPFLSLDWRAWKSHQRDVDAMAVGLEPELPAQVEPCDCGVCNECMNRHDVFTNRASLTNRQVDLY